MFFRMQPTASSAPNGSNSSGAAASGSNSGGGPVAASRWLLFALVAGGGLAADLWTKSYMFHRLGMPDHGRVWWVWPEVFGFQTSLNEGALFGIGQGRQPLFIVLALGALVGVFYWLFYAGAARDGWLCLSLSGITAGVLGNLYDRLGLHGLVWPSWHPAAGEPVYAVRDVILVMIGRYHWPNFNIADSLLVGGAAVLIAHSLLVKPPEATTIAAEKLAGGTESAAGSPPGPSSA